MNIVNALVCHKSYGVGTVVSQSDSIINVQFPGEFGMKRFLYPSVFENYIVLCNDELQEAQMVEISKIHAERNAILAAQKAEEDKRQRAERASRYPAKKKRSCSLKAGKNVPDDSTSAHKSI